MVAPLTVVYLDHTAKWSGGEVALFRTLAAIDRGHVNPIVLLAEDGPFRERLMAAGIEVHVMPLSESVREVRKDSLGAAAIAGKAIAAVALFRYARSVANFARLHDAAILHCNSLKSDFYGALAGKIAHIPVIWHVRDHIDPAYLPGPAVRLFRTLARVLPSYVITNSLSSTGKLFPSGPGKQHARTVYDGLADNELTSPAPGRRSRFRNDPPRVGLVGRIVPWKGQHVLLAAAKRLTERGVEARYVIVGAPLFGIKEQEYESQLHAQAQDLDGRVEFTGFQSDIPAVLRDLDILVHTSTSPEPFGQVVIEGMAEGLPVIASDGGGVKEIIADPSIGILTPMGDAGALADALESLLSDPERASALALAGWQAVHTKFTARQSARGVEDVYDDLLRSSNSRNRTAASSERETAPSRIVDSRASMTSSSALGADKVVSAQRNSL